VQTSKAILKQALQQLYRGESKNCGGDITRDQPNSRYHGHDTFCEIGLCPWKTHFSVKMWFSINLN